MRRIGLVPFVLVFFMACNNDKTTEAKKEETTAANDITQNPVYQKGTDLVAKNGCLTCHAIEDKINGPAYRDVANKYAGQDTAVSYLAKKIIGGGSGVWGEAPMLAHPTLSQEDAEALARYVLLFKK
jgi:cytochrome c